MLAFLKYLCVVRMCVNLGICVSKKLCVNIKHVLIMCHCFSSCVFVSSFLCFGESCEVGVDGEGRVLHPLQVEERVQKTKIQDIKY